MIDKDTIREILNEARQVYNSDYIEHCGLNHVRTFYFYCERLSKEPAGTVVSSTRLNAYIKAELRLHGDSPGVSFNPHGWFGKARTDWIDPAKDETNFKSEYLDVLIRKGSDPYSYQIRPECYGDVVEILAEFRNSARQ